MVHVLSCHQFAGDLKVLTPSQEPLAIFASPTQMFVATVQHSINVYSLVEHGSLQHSFTTAGLVKQGVYCTTGNYIAALEVRGGTHQATSIRIYFNWETSGPQNAVRARVAGGEMQTCERGSTIATSSYDDQEYPRQRNQFELIEVQTPTPAQCISCCPATGNLAAGINNTVYLYRFVTHQQGMLSQCPDFEYLMQIQVGLVVRDVAFCEGIIACLGTCEVQVCKIRVWDTSAGKLIRGRSVTDTEGCKVSKSNGGKRRVPMLIKPPLSSQDGDASLHLEAEKSWTSSTHLTKTESQISQPYFVSDEGAGCGWDFGIEAVTVASSKISSAGQKRNQDVDDSESASVLFPTVQSEEPYSEGSVDNCEIIGPIGMIQGHPVQITVTKKKQPEKIKSSLTQLLYRRFIKLNLSEVENDDDNSLHSLQLSPTYTSEVSDDSRTQPSNDMMESHNAHKLAGLCCFFSTSKQGFLYEMQPIPRLLTEYTYKADAIQVQAGYSLLFALTQNGLETYTLHTLAAALLNMETVDNIHNTCPPATLDVSLVGLEPYLGLTQLAVSKDHVMLLSRTRDSTNPTPSNKSATGTSISSKSNTIYIHEKSAPTAVYKSLMELGERYQHSSPAAYLQCMLEGHLLLRTAMTLGRLNNVPQGIVSESTDCDASSSELRSLYLQSCLQLALHYCRGETPNWHLTLPYFNMSELPLKKIIECSPKPYTAFEDTELMTGAGLGMLHYLDWVLFDDSSTLHADQVTADRILKYFFSLGPQHCSQVVLFSKIADQLSPDKTLSVLSKVKDAHQPGHHVNFVGCPQTYTWCNLDRLAMCEVYLRLGDLEQAGSTLCTLSAEEITQLCTQHSALLLQAEDQFSHLAQLIRQQEPESLLIALVQLIDDNTVSLQTCIKLLKDEKEPLSSAANSHLKRFMEELVFTKHRHEVLHGATELLFAIYFERMEKGMSKGVPLRHSSRHTHIFSGGGCYAKRPEWLDFLAPFQGTEALTFKCFQQAPLVVPSMPRRARSYSDRSQIPIIGKFGGGQRSSGTDQLRQSTLAAAKGDGKEEDVVCPCCCCNEDLLAIQSLITSHCATPTMARQVQHLTGIALSTAPTQPGLKQSLQSLHIVCLAVLDPPAAMELLIQDHPGIVLDYAQDSFGKDTLKWKDLLNMLLERGADLDAKGSNQTGIATKGHTDYLQVLTGVLGHASNLLTPEELLQCLPSEGSLSFFLPYLRQSGCRQNARLLHQQLVDTLAS
ncbi:BLOC-2 complex member HPS3-like isoform X1 [Asterias amurensis]|uniref:BLOC-2 complex member HPS3-like isoform X1 n=1 Tax=Asterias amurensis TaxID=7602 RepID=UPI003AB31D53